ITVNSACNVGVNCAQPTLNSSCGRADFANPTFAQDSQLAADGVTFSAKNGKLWQLFTNHSFNTANVQVNAPPVQTFTAPILPGTCGTSCNPDPAALETFCNFPNPFPACNPGNAVTVATRQTLNLAPGTYGDIVVMNLATLNLSPGTYDICSFST